MLILYIYSPISYYAWRSLPTPRRLSDAWEAEARAPRFDPSKIESIDFEDEDVIFDLGTIEKRFAIEQLNQSEADIAYEYLTYKYDKEGWEEEGKSILDPRPWMKPKWYLKFNFYTGMAITLFLIAVVVIVFITHPPVNHINHGPTWVPDWVNDPQLREIKNLEDANDIVMNDSLYKEISSSSNGMSSSGGSVDPASKGYLNYSGQLYEVHMDTKGQPSYHFDALVDIDNKTVLNITRSKNN